jgi:hypothetical protein
MALSGSAGGEYPWPQRRFCGDYAWPATRLLDFGIQQLEIDIYYANKALANTLKSFFGTKDSRFAESTRDQSISEVEAWANRNADSCGLRVFEYDDFPTYGLSAVDYRRPDSGYIHVSHFVRGVSPDDTPYVELAWKTNRPHPMYAFYSSLISGQIEAQRRHIFSSGRHQ